MSALIMSTGSARPASSPHGLCCGHVSRRKVLAGLGVLAGASMLAGRTAFAQSAQSAGPAVHAIDVHHHYVPPAYLQMLTSPQGVVRDWSLAKDLDNMDRAGTDTAILSPTSAPVWFGDAGTAIKAARICNDFAAKMAADHPGRFRLFAALPLVDIDASLHEIEYGLDTLKAEGIALFTSYNDVWLGDLRFAPVFEELNRRKALVYTHPTEPLCCSTLLTSTSPPVSNAIIEYGTDTTRTIASYLFSGAARRYPDVRFIFSHAGGTMPYLIERFQTQAKIPGAAAKLPQDGLSATLARYYYDTAQSANPATMAALRKVVPVSQILFGTDFPWATSLEDMEGLSTVGFDQAELSAIYRENAMRLMPQLHA